jgi:hypothetical protein
MGELAASERGSYTAFMRLLAAVPLLAFAAGCSVNVADEGAEGEPDANVQGVVHVESTMSKSGALRTHVSARFLRVSGIDGRTAEEVVGMPGWLGPRSSSTATAAPIQLGCAEVALSKTVPASARPVQGSIELIDVGDIVVHMSDVHMRDRAMPLAARAFPDVGDLVSGVVYTSRDDQTELIDNGTYLIETSGSASIDGFSIQVDAPAAPSGLRVAGVAAIDGEAMPIVAGQPLPVGWDSPARAGDNDLIFVELVATDAAGDSSLVRCAFEDDGAAIVPAALTAFAGAEVDMFVHRYRQTSVKLAGIDEAYVDFDFAVAVQLTVQ